MSIRKRTPGGSRASDRGEVDLRIIGGAFRGTKLAYHGDPVTRPMKHRVREAIFNLVSTEAKGRHAVDVFAGTGALGLEAISRGAASATFIERHVPTARTVRENIERLGIQDRCELLEASAFVWAKRDLATGSATRGWEDIPWLVFVSPPYAFFVDRQAEMLTLISTLMQHAPGNSTVVVEADDRFDFALLSEGEQEKRWDVRPYPPAVVGVWRKKG